MKKSLTLALAIIALAVSTVVSIAQGAQQKDKQKSPPPKSAETKPAPTTPPAPMAKNSAHATEQVMTGTVTKVDEKARTFIIKTANGEQFTFSAKEIPPPKKDEQVAVTYIQTTPGGSLEARRYKEVRTQQGRAEDKDDSPKVVTGEVTKVDKEAQTFTVKTANGEQFTFSAKAAPLPKKEEQVAVTYIQTTPGGQLEARAVTVKGKGSNSDNRMAGGIVELPSAGYRKVMTGEVTKVDEKAQTFTIRTKEGKEVTFSRAKRIAYGEDSRRDLLQVGSIIDVTYTENPGGTKEARAVTVRPKGSNSDNRVADDVHSAQQITGKVLRVNKEAKTFTIMTKGKVVTLSTEKLKGPPPEVGKIYDITYTPNPGGPNWSINLNSSRSNIY